MVYVSGKENYLTVSIVLSTSRTRPRRCRLAPECEEKWSILCAVSNDTAGNVPSVPWFPRFPTSNTFVMTDQQKLTLTFPGGQTCTASSTRIITNERPDGTRDSHHEIRSSQPVVAGQ